MAVPLVDSCIGVISVSLCSGTFGFARLRSRFFFSADTISVVRYGSGLAVCVRGGRGVATVVLEAGEILRSLVGFTSNDRGRTDVVRRSFVPRNSWTRYGQ